MIDKPEFIRQTQESRLSSRFGSKTCQNGYQRHDGHDISLFLRFLNRVYYAVSDPRLSPHVLLNVHD